MTVHGKPADFVLAEEEVAILRKFLNNGGFLLVEADEGRPSFDTAFREQIVKVLPGKPLDPLQQGHPIYSQLTDAKVVKVRPALALLRNNQIEIAPELFGIELNGTPLQSVRPQRRLGTGVGTLRIGIPVQRSYSAWCEHSVSCFNTVELPFPLPPPMAGVNDFLNAQTMRKLERLALRSRYVVEGFRAGTHASPLKGASMEFADHRQYVKGDNLRHHRPTRGGSGESAERFRYSSAPRGSAPTPRLRPHR